MNRSFLRKLTTMAAGLLAVVAFTTTNVGCNCNKPCGGCDKPCAKKCPPGCKCPDCAKKQDGAKKEEPKKEEPKKEEPKKP